jgi:DNA-binding transcriptional ArsR family regulator
VPPSAPPTQSDREALAFAAEHRFVLAAQLAIALGISPAAAGRRLRRLRDAGYVRRPRLPSPPGE